MQDLQISDRSSMKRTIDHYLFEGSDESEGQTNDRRFLRYAKINTPFRCKQPNNSYYPWTS